MDLTPQCWKVKRQAPKASNSMPKSPSMSWLYWLAVSVLVSVGLCAGCATNARDRELDLALYWGTKSGLNSPMSAADLYERATATGETRSVRSLFICSIFATYIKPGFTSAQIRTVLPDPNWLKDCEIRPIGGLGGANPVHSPNGHSPFVLVLYPDRNGSSDWVISMVLPNRHGHLTLEDVRKFLEGSNPEPGLRITEFAIEYPLSKSEEKPPGARLTERFTKRGVGLIVTPSPF